MKKEIFVVEVERDEEYEKTVVNIDRLGKSIERLIKQIEKLDRMKLQVHLKLKDRAIASIEDTCEIGLSIDVDVTMACSDLNLADEIRKELGDATTPLDIRRWIWCSDAEKFADGGVIRGPHVGIVGEAGPEAIIPLSPEKRAWDKALWYEAGNVLGVYDGTYEGYTPIDQREVNSCGSLSVKMYADGGIVGDTPDDALKDIFEAVNLIQSDDNQEIWESSIGVAKGLAEEFRFKNASNSSDVLGISSNILGEMVNWLKRAGVDTHDADMLGKFVGGLGVAADITEIMTTNPVDREKVFFSKLASWITGAGLAKVKALEEIPFVNDVLTFLSEGTTENIYDRLKERNSAGLKDTQFDNFKSLFNEYYPGFKTIADITTPETAMDDESKRIAYDQLTGELVPMGLHGMQKGLLAQSEELLPEAEDRFRRLEFENYDYYNSIADMVNYIWKAEEEWMPNLVGIYEKYDSVEDAHGPLMEWIDDVLKTEDGLGNISRTLSSIKNGDKYYEGIEEMISSDPIWFMNRLLEPYYNKLVNDLFYWKINENKMNDLREFGRMSQEGYSMSYKLKNGEDISQAFSNIQQEDTIRDYNKSDKSDIYYTVSNMAKYGTLDIDLGPQKDANTKLAEHYKEVFIKGEKALERLGYFSIENAARAFNNIGDSSLKGKVYDILNDLLIISDTASDIVPNLNFEFEGEKGNRNLIFTNPDTEKVVERPEGWISSLGLSKNLDIEPAVNMGNVGLNIADNDVKLWNNPSSSLGRAMNLNYSGMLASNSGIYISDTLQSYTVYDTGIHSQTSERVAINVGGLGGINVTLNLDEPAEADISSGVKYQISDFTEEVAQVIASRLSQVHSNIPCKTID